MLPTEFGEIKKPFDGFFFSQILTLFLIMLTFEFMAVTMKIPQVSLVILIAFLLGIIPFVRYNKRRYKDKRNIIMYSICVGVAAASFILTMYISNMVSLSPNKELVENPLGVESTVGANIVVTEQDIENTEKNI